MQTGLDHILLGINDLNRGVAWVEQRTGVRAEFGGIHPGRGTCNALLSLGPDCYLEIIAPDPGQPSPGWFPQINKMTEPRLLTWAAHTSDLTALANHAAAAGWAVEEPHDGARARPDGTILKWRLIHLEENRGGILPFFIEWGSGSVHPAADAPSGCRLETFEVESPNADGITPVFQVLSIEVRVKAGANPLLRARIESPQGLLELTS